jgi:hypothetical protein
MYRKQTSIFETFKLRGVAATLALASGLALTGCGGGGTTGTPFSGKVIDGYIKGAKVCIDLNANGSCDAGEPSATTGEGGAYTLFAQEGVSVAGKYLVAEVTISAEDSDNPGQPAKPAKLLAFAEQPTLITPLTTVVAGFVKADTTLTAAQAEAKAETLLGLPAGFNFQDDFIAKSDPAAHAAARVIYQGLANVVGTGAIDDTALKLALANTADLAKQAYADPTQLTTLLASADSQTQDVAPVYKTVAAVDMKKFNGYEVMRSRFVPQYSGNVAAGYVLFSGEFGAGITVNNFADYTAKVNKDNGPVKFKIDLYASQKAYGESNGLAEFDLVWLTTNGYWHGEQITVQIPEDGKNRWKTYEIDTSSQDVVAWGDRLGVLADDNLLQIKTGKNNYAGPNIEVMVGKIQMSNDNWATSVTITPDNNWGYFSLADTYPEYFVVPTALAGKGDLVKMIKTACCASPYSGMTQVDFASGLSGSSVTMEIDVYQESASFPFNVVAQEAGNYKNATSVAALNAASADAKGNWKTYRFTLNNFDAAVHTELVILPDPGVAASDQTMYVSNMKVVEIYNPFK